MGPTLLIAGAAGVALSALAPMAIGLLFAGGLVMARSQNHSLIEWTLTLGAAVLAMRRLNPALILCLAAAVGWVLAL